MIGKRHLSALRARAKEALGARFDPRRFHDRVLLNGPVPLTTLEDVIQRWIAQPTP
jgi:uncharacterized protein (DUF885 family)